MLYLLSLSSSKLCTKWQGYFEVTQRVGNVDYEVKRMDRSRARQVYHLNHLKPWKEVVPLALVGLAAGVVWWGVCGSGAGLSTGL